MEEKRKLTDQELQEVSGGYIYDNGEDYEPENERYFILDNSGNIIRRYGGKPSALLYCQHNEINRRFLTYEQWQRLKKTGSPD